MEFIGRVKQLLPQRSGTSQRTGNEWKALPFIFEYFEHDTDRYPDSVLLETFDTKVIDNLKKDMEVRCGFSHHTREYEGKVYNEIRLYKIESVKKAQPAGNPAGTVAQPQAAPEPQYQQAAEAQEDPDDLPF